MALTWKGGCGGGGGGDYVAGAGINITGNVISAEVTQASLDAALDNLLEGTITGITITTPPTKTVYNSGETLDLTGMTVAAVYANGRTQPISGYTTSPANGATLTDTTSNVVVSWAHEGATYTASQAITVNRVLSSIAVTQPTKASYTQGEALDLSGAVVTASYTSGATANVTASSTFTPANGSTLSTVGTQTITASYTEGGVTKTATTTVTVNNPVTINTWANATDEQVVSMLQAHYNGDIDIHDYWSVGDEREIQLSAMAATGVNESHPAQTVKMVLVNAGGKKLADGVTDCAFVVQIKGTLGPANGGTSERGYMNSTNTNTGGWNGCARRTWCNDVFYNAFPTAIKDIFKQHINKAGTGGGSSSGTQDSTDYFALPAEIEVFGTTAFSVAGEGTQFSYYATTANRVKYIDSSTIADWWWLRSPDSGRNTNFCSVYTNGSAYHNTAGTNYGLAPCGCI